MWTSAPFRYDDARVHRNQMVSGTSSGRPSLRIGICERTRSSVPGDSIAVSISPGAIAMHRTPRGPDSWAISRVSAASAAFEVDLQGVVGTVGPRAGPREGVARDGQYAPAVVAEALHGGMADAAARTGQQERLSISHRASRGHRDEKATSSCQRIGRGPARGRGPLPAQGHAGRARARDVRRGRCRVPEDAVEHPPRHEESCNGRPIRRHPVPKERSEPHDECRRPRGHGRHALALLPAA